MVQSGSELGLAFNALVSCEYTLSGFLESYRGGLKWGNIVSPCLFLLSGGRFYACFSGGLGYEGECLGSELVVCGLQYSLCGKEMDQLKYTDCILLNFWSILVIGKTGTAHSDGFGGECCPRSQHVVQSGKFIHYLCDSFGSHSHMQVSLGFSIGKIFEERVLVEVRWILGWRFQH